MKRNHHLPLWLAPTIFILLLVFCSCGTLKRSLNKSKEKESIESKESTKTAESVTNTLTTVQNRTITESIDTNIEIKSDSLKAEFTFDNLLDGDEIEEESEDITLNIKFDSVSNKVKVLATKKKQVIPVKAEKKTIEAINQQSLTQSNKTVDEKKVLNSDKLIKKKRVDSEAKSGINWTLIIIFIILLIAIAWYLYRKFR